MNYRLATIWPRKEYTANATETIDIKLKDPISQLVITDEIQNTDNGGESGTAHPARCVTKIELVDGSDVLYALDGREAEAVDFYHNKRVPAALMTYLNDNKSERIFNLNFGRHLYDPMLALDPKRFTNLQLKITLDIDGGGYLPDYQYLTVLAHCFDEKVVSPVGFLMHKEFKSYTLAAASHEYIDLPTDYPYRKLLLRAQAYGSGPDYQFDTIKLSQDNDKKVPLNHTIGDILRAIISQTPQYEEWILVPGLNSVQTFYCTPGYWPSFTANMWRHAPTIPANAIALDTGDGGLFYIIPSGQIFNTQIHVRGWCPHNTIEIPFGLQDDPDDWFAPLRESSLELDVKGGASLTAGTCEVMAQQLRKY